MTNERKQYLDSLWMNTDVGRWAIALSESRKADADKILGDIFENGCPIPLEYLMQEEKKLCKKIKNELMDDNEGKEYIMLLDEKNYNLMDIMVAYDFSLLDLYYA